MFARHLARRRLLYSSAALAGSCGGLYLYASRNDSNLRPGERPTHQLLRSYAVFSMCSIPSLVDNSPRILETLSSIPIIKQVTEAFVRITFFDQFVGGDTAHDALPLLRELRASNKGALFAYSVEVNEHDATAASTPREKEDESSRIVNEMIRCIDVAADFESQHSNGPEGRRTWVAVKITALTPDAKSLIRLSKFLVSSRPSLSLPVAFPGSPHPSDLDVVTRSPQGNDFLTREDIAAIDLLYRNLTRICARAQEKGVKIIIDAEYSWYQPALDALAFALMRKFNALDKNSVSDSVQPLIYATVQSYLRRSPNLLAQAIADSKKYNYSLGVKLVRGAYHIHEIEAHGDSHNPSLDPTAISISTESHPPVWRTKAETDECYNQCVRMLYEEVAKDVERSRSYSNKKGRGTKDLPRIGILFGTHNWESCHLILDEAVRYGLAECRSPSSASSAVVATASTEVAEGKGQEEEETLWLKDEMTERITVGQLYGMGDALSDWLSDRTRSKAPFIIKYVPYGALSEVMPYLSRRAIENKSLLGEGGAVIERRRASIQIWRKMIGQ